MNIRNTGARDGEEVAQVYCKHTSYAVQNARLCGFERVFIRAGETVTVRLKLDEECFYCVDNQGRKCLEEKRVLLFVDGCQPRENSLSINAQLVPD